MVSVVSSIEEDDITESLMGNSNTLPKNMMAEELERFSNGDMIPEYEN